MPQMHHWVQMSLGGILFGVHDNQWSIADLALNGNFGEVIPWPQDLSRWACAVLLLPESNWLTSVGKPVASGIVSALCSSVWGSRQDNRHIIVTYVLLHALSVKLSLMYCHACHQSYCHSCHQPYCHSCHQSYCHSCHEPEHCSHLSCHLSAVSCVITCTQLPSHLASVTGSSHQLSCHSGSLSVFS